MGNTWTARINGYPTGPYGRGQTSHGLLPMGEGSRPTPMYAQVSRRAKVSGMWFLSRLELDLGNVFSSVVSVIITVRSQ